MLTWTLAGCQPSIDTVAASYGDYDPRHDPQMLDLKQTIPVTDPALFRWQGIYYLFSSGPGISVHRSSDLTDFEAAPQVFAQNPAWIAESLPQVTDLWCPHVVAWNGTIHLYYAASTFSSRRSCIGHATTASLDQPFVDRGSVICSNLTATADDYNTIDPAVILAAPDEPWMVFGSWDSGIKLIALDRDGGRRDDTIHAIAARSSDNPAIQAAYLYHWRDDFYLFVSFDSSPNHSLRVGRAAQIQGPYLDRDGVDMLAGGGTVLLASGTRFKGPGSNMVFDDQDRRLDVFHAYDADQNGTAVLRIGEIFFDNDGWPVSAGP